MSRMTLDLSDEIDNKLTDIARRGNISKAEVMRRAFALLAIADEEKQKPGFSLGIVKEDPTDHSLQVVAKLIGV